MATNQQNLTIAQLGIQHPDVAFDGQLRYGKDNSFVRTLDNGSGIVSAKKTLTVDTYTASATYAFDVQGTTISLVEDGLTDENGVAAELADEINKHPDITIGFARVSGAVITIESVFPGVDFELSTTDAKLTAAVITAAGEGSIIGFGKAIVHSGGNGVLPANGSLTPRRLDIVGVTGQTDIILAIAGQRVAAGDATAADFKTALDAALVAAGVDALVTTTVATNDVQILAATGGQWFDVTYINGTGTLNIAEAGSNIDNALVGFTYAEDWVQGTDTIEAGAAMNVWTRGEGLTRQLASPSTSDVLYIEASTGTIYNAAAAGRVSTDRLSVMEVLDSKWGILKLVA